MGFEARKVEMDYNFAQLLPEDDSTFVEYKRFKSYFKEDGNQLILGTDFDNLKTLDNFNSWYDLGYKIKAMSAPKTTWKNKQWETRYLAATDSVFSIAHIFTLVKNTEKKEFDFVNIVPQKPKTQAELDSIFVKIKELPFYKGLVYNNETNSTLMIVFVNRDVLNSNARETFIADLDVLLKEYEPILGRVHRTGVPYIRTIITLKTKEELRFFIMVSAFLTALLLYLFFRSFKVVIYSMLVVAVGVTWSLGIIGLLGFKLSGLMGLIPSLIIVIGVPNSVYLINKYHQEYRLHGNKILALNRVIRKIGSATLLTNATTAMGFATFIFTDSRILIEFGIAASINIMIVFVLTIFIIPIVFSLLGDPKPRHVKHLDRLWVVKLINQLVNVVSGHRKAVYWVSFFVFIMSLIGISKIRTTGNMVDDLPKGDMVKEDLIYFQDSYGGVLPFEVLIDTYKPGKAIKSSTLTKIEQLQLYFDSVPEFSRSLSITDALKFAKQAYYNGRPSKYSLITGREKSFIAPYLKAKKDSSNENTEENMAAGFLSPNKQVVRVTLQMADIGTVDLENLLARIKPRVDQIFNPGEYDIIFTGNSVAFLKGTAYLVHNLFISLTIAIGLIAILMAFLFKSFRMVLISMIPNILPLLFTGGVMGWFGIPLKVSTILVFSIAFGISIDDTIHYLAKFRQELHANDDQIKPSVLGALRETGLSMFYTSIILFFGFGVFILSNFGSTIAMGTLVSLTLLVAMFSNLVLLPSLLLSLDKRVTVKAMEEPVFEMIERQLPEEDDEEEEDELEDEK
jgi:predicted RND superfamily exporter protein